MAKKPRKSMEPIDPEDPIDPLPEEGLNPTQQAEVQQMILESMPGWGTDGLFLVFIYASWWWLLECPQDSLGIEIAAGTPFWKAVLEQGGPEGAASKLGCQRIIKQRLAVVGGKLTRERHELNRQEDGSWL